MEFESTISDRTWLPTYYLRIWFNSFWPSCLNPLPPPWVQSINSKLYPGCPSTQMIKVRVLLHITFLQNLSSRVFTINIDTLVYSSGPLPLIRLFPFLYLDHTQNFWELWLSTLFPFTSPVYKWRVSDLELVTTHLNEKSILKNFKI